jgi:predicted small metal-binding protein
MGAIANFLLADDLRPPTLQPNASSEMKGEAMRAIECPCGHHLEAADDAELFRLAREHVDRDHPELQRSDDELRQRIAADAYDA